MKVPSSPPRRPPRRSLRRMPESDFLLLPSSFDEPHTTPNTHEEEGRKNNGGRPAPLLGRAADVGERADN